MAVAKSSNSDSNQIATQLKDVPLRFVTAAALFDGHDAAINVIRRILQDQGCEVIHLGHNRSVQEVLKAALDEDADGIAISSYQGGHNEYFRYLIDLLKKNKASHVQVFGGGGGVILPKEKKQLESYGVNRIFLPSEGMELGLDGMGRYIVEACQEARAKRQPPQLDFKLENWSRSITALEYGLKEIPSLDPKAKTKSPPVVLGITGTGGAGKSSLVDELCLRLLHEHKDLKLAIYSIDPTKKKTGGALLGDRIRMNSITDDRVFMRSIATRGGQLEIADCVQRVVDASKQADFDLVIVETLGIGQGSSSVTSISDFSLYVMTSDFGASSQLEKIDMIDYADVIAVNKFERRGSEDALREVKKQYCRSRKLFEAKDKEGLPIYGTRCNIFNDTGVTQLYRRLLDLFREKNTGFPETKADFPSTSHFDGNIIPPEKTFYLSDVAKAVRTYKADLDKRANEADQAFYLLQASKNLNDQNLKAEADKAWKALGSDTQKSIESWSEIYKDYHEKTVSYRVRDKEIKAPQMFESLSHSTIQRVVPPELKTWGDVLSFMGRENLPGYFPFTAGIYPFKRKGEEPRRQFAGEGSPEKTNKRFHYLSRHDEAKRLSTAFDSVTLYGEDPDERPDIYGKVGESGVSIASLDDMKTLYKGFNLCSPSTSVSMTINGPAPIILAMYLNAAIDQQVEQFESKNSRAPSGDEKKELISQTLKMVRGTVQADILKEDQAQNTCIFSTEFALKMMGDIQEYFIDHEIRNYYSVSISGYHIAEAGANPITQLAFTLANGFTLVEYYLARGMSIDAFVPNLSFFFSNGLDPEYSVIGRVARRIWAISMRDLYLASERSQKLKYHIQTSGRSLHAQEIEFNDIRTTLQALTALYDNCNSLHTNAYDEAITTPTEESVRRAMAIQMIIDKEFGSSRIENFTQGSFAMNRLTDLVEEAVLDEFERISARGGVLGAMESQYQRSKIQEESLYYEELKHKGDLPIIGVNTFLSDAKTDADAIPLARSNESEKDARLKTVQKFQKVHSTQSQKDLEALKKAALANENIFGELMNCVRSSSLGQISRALYEVGGRYRRNM